MKIVKEADGLMTVSNDKKLYALQDDNIVIIAEQRIKSAQISFYTEDEWQKKIEKAKRKLSPVPNKSVTEK